MRIWGIIFMETLRMKKLLLFLFIAPIVAWAQADLPKVVDDTLFTTYGYKAVVGMDVKLGTGTLPNGDFKFVSMQRGPFIAPGGPRRRPDPVEVGWSGRILHIKRFHKSGTEKTGYNYYLVMGAGTLFNYVCDIENAIASGEIVVPEEYRPRVAAQGGAAPSSVDQLKKLKDLLDAGAITQNEYDSAKKKILAKM
jgi:hypothetical protein